MEILPIEYKKYGYTFKQVQRQGDVAIYSQSNEDRNEPIAFIVFIVQKQEASNIYGRDYPPKETTPGNSFWGQYAYTCHTLQRAEIRMKQLQERISNRNSQPMATVLDNIKSYKNDFGEDPFGGLDF